MFKTLLIANRGEIACRIIATARKLGIKTIAVFSDADAHARHVRQADDAVHLGPSPAAQSYLRGDLILQAAQRMGADAIHPGYGFLSENADFAQACTDANVVFVGPSPRAITDMGLKDRAKAIAERVGAPILPGYWGEDQSPERLQAEAIRIGFPLLVKALAGGGGRGIRAVHHEADVLPALASAKREAAAAFGDDRVMLEALVSRPRHIEVQIFGDRHGNLVHMFERDCSIQRRRQKLLEEAPAPGITPTVRAALTDAALKIARAVDYDNAGTVEFVADGTGPLRPDGFWFLEMNTRLQVEHPVTEAVTGLDLVEWQLRVAAGEPLPLSQDQITCTGAAIEARIVAEDPDQGFLPSSGRIAGFAPASPLRVDSGFDVGDVFPDAYDSLIQKVIAHGPDRAGALDALRAHLQGQMLLGVTTNNGYLARLCDVPAFWTGGVHTGLLEDAASHLAKTPATHPRLAGLAAIGVQIAREHAARKQASPFGAADGWRLNGPPHLSVSFAHDGGVLVAQMQSDAHQISARIDGNHAIVARNTLVLDENSQGLTVRMSDQPTTTILVTGAGAHVIEAGEVWAYVFPRTDGGEAGLEAGDDIKANLPGKIAALSCGIGDKVKKGDALVVLEAMKMEHSLLAPRDGVVEAVAAHIGKQVRAGEILVQLVPEEADA